MKLARYLLLALVCFGLLPLACVSSQAPPDVDRSEVLDTSSPDEPVFDPNAISAAATTGSTLWVRESMSNSTISGVTLQGSSYTGPMVISSGKETLTEIVYKRFTLANDYANGGNAKWGDLQYNQIDPVYAGWKVTGIKAEHAIYMHSPRGTILLQDLFIFDIGAQGFQLTWRGAETTDPTGYQKTGIHRLVRCSFIKCGQPRGIGRASYAVSMFGWQSGGGTTPRQAWDCPVELENVTIEHDSKGQYELRGALLVEWRPGVWIKNCRINYVGTADRDVVHLYQNQTVRVEDSYIHGSRPFDIDGSRVKSVVFTSLPSATFDGNGGDTKVRINGVVVGTTDDEIVWHK